MGTIPHRKKSWLWLLAAAGAFGIAVILICIGSSGNTDRFDNVQAYVEQRMKQQKEVSFYSGEKEKTAAVVDAKIGWLEWQGEAVGLAPEGILEAWTYNILVKPDAPTEEIMLVGGMYEQDGYFDLEGQGGHVAVVLRYHDGGCDVLYDAPVNDGMDFYGYHLSWEEALHDWYVTEHGLDLPLYVRNLPSHTTDADGNPWEAPAHRYDGVGFYLYIPVSAWEYVTVDPLFSDTHWEWISRYNTGATLTVTYHTQSAEDMRTVAQKQGYAQVSGTPTVDGDRHVTLWHLSDGKRNSAYYFHEAQDGGCYRIQTEWYDTESTDPAIAREAEAMHMMAESFVVTD